MISRETLGFRRRAEGPAEQGISDPDEFRVEKGPVRTMSQSE